MKTGLSNIFLIRIYNVATGCVEYVDSQVSHGTRSVTCETDITVILQAEGW